MIIYIFRINKPGKIIALANLENNMLSRKRNRNLILGILDELHKLQ